MSKEGLFEKICSGLNDFKKGFNPVHCFPDDPKFSKFVEWLRLRELHFDAEHPKTKRLEYHLKFDRYVTDMILIYPEIKTVEFYVYNYRGWTPATIDFKYLFNEETKEDTQGRERPAAT